MIPQRFLLTVLNKKKLLFGATNIVKHRDKNRHVYSGYGIAFDGAGS